MKTLPAALAAQVAATSYQPVFCAALSGWGGATVRWNTSGADLTVGGQVYDARYFQFDAIETDAAGKPVEVSLAVANQDLAVSDLCDQSNPRGALLTLYRVFLADVTAIQTLAARLEVQSHRITDPAVEFRALGPLGRLRRRRIPARTYGRLCPWEFKGAECGYAGAPSYCSVTDPTLGPHEFTAEACQSLNNFLNFGGFRFVMPRRP